MQFISRFGLLFSILLALVMGSGCSSVQKSQINRPVQIEIRSDMKAHVDVDMTKKLVGYASGGYLFNLIKVAGDDKYLDHVAFNGHEPGIFSFLSKVNTIKGAAAYNAIRTSDADILVNPQYVVEESHWNPFYKQIKVKVTGYPGKIIKIKNVP
jgi:hypothetical protein